MFRLDRERCDGRPLVLCEIGYKLIWLIEDMTYAFLPVVAPIALAPLGYVFRTYGHRP